jgi:hypothetical protein
MEQELAENTKGAGEEEGQHQEPAIVARTREVSALEQIFIALHKSMMTSFRAKDFKSANRMAHQLLERYDTPPLIRGRCHLVLSTAGGDYIAHAKEAVRILTELEKQFPDMPKEHLRSAQNALKQAYEDEKAKENGEIDFLTDDEEAFLTDDEEGEKESDLTGNSVAVEDAATGDRDNKQSSGAKQDDSAPAKDIVVKQSEVTSLPPPARKPFKTYQALYPNGLFGKRSDNRERTIADNAPPTAEQTRTASTGRNTTDVRFHRNP